MEDLKNLALVAHDNRKKDLAEWVAYNYQTLGRHKLFCTGTTGKIVEETVKKRTAEDGIEEIVLAITRLKSGPLGGDQQIGAMIAEGRIDVLIFFWDPMESQPHDVDVKALLRLAVLYNIPTACNRATADFIISSHLFHEDYEAKKADFSAYLSRTIPGGGLPD